MSPNSSSGKDPEGKRFDQVNNIYCLCGFYFPLLLDIMGTKCSSCPISRSSPWSWKSSRLPRASWEDQEGQDGRGPGGDEDKQLPAPPREEVSGGEST